MAILEGSTFSALVDDVLLRSGKPNRKQDIIAYARNTVRECLLLESFMANLIETQLTVDAVPFIWKRPELLRIIVAIKYPYFTAHGNPVFAKEQRPGRNQGGMTDYYYYLTGDAYAMNGLAVGAIVDVAYLAYMPRLKYYETESDRPARYDIETGVWTYHADYASSTEQQEVARDLVTNWLIFRWYDLIIEGTLAKVFKATGDERSNMAYSLYKQGQKDLRNAEGKVSLELMFR